MKQIIMSIILLLFSLVAMADQYRVELCVFENKVDHHYFQQKGIQDVQYVIDRNDLYRYFIGDFEDKETAETIWLRAKNRGIKYARVVNYTEEQLACANSCSNPDEIQHLLFDFDQYTLRSQSTRDLDNVSYHLKSNTTHSVQLEGHTDARGVDGYNEELSYDRVMTAKRYLINTGVESQRIITEQYGETQPIAKNIYLGQDSPEGRQFNRRVMITILDEFRDEIEGMVRPLNVPELLRTPFFQSSEPLLTMAF